MAGGGVGGWEGGRGLSAQEPAGTLGAAVQRQKVVKGTAQTWFFISYSLSDSGNPVGPEGGKPGLILWNHLHVLVPFSYILTRTSVIPLLFLSINSLSLSWFSPGIGLPSPFLWASVPPWASGIKTMLAMMKNVMIVEWSWSHSYYLLMGIALNQNVHILRSLPSIDYVQSIYIKSLPTTSHRVGIIIGPLNR